jgi:hypothetical protein
MKIFHKEFLVLVAALLLTTLSGCSLIGDIFQAGVWVGILMVVVVVIIAAMIVSKLRKK